MPFIRDFWTITRRRADTGRWGDPERFPEILHLFKILRPILPAFYLFLEEKARFYDIPKLKKFYVPGRKREYGRSRVHAVSSSILLFLVWYEAILRLFMGFEPINKRSIIFLGNALCKGDRVSILFCCEKICYNKTCKKRWRQDPVFKVEKFTDFLQKARAPTHGFPGTILQGEGFYEKISGWNIGAC